MPFMAGEPRPSQRNAVLRCLLKVSGMNTASSLVLLLALIGGIATGPAAAAERLPYSPSRFAKAQTDGKPIFVHVTAPWCVVCKVQDSVIERDLLKPEFAKAVLFDVDFDSQKDVLKRFGISDVSTLVVFKGATETARLIGGTDSGLIEAMMYRAVD